MSHLVLTREIVVESGVKHRPICMQLIMNNRVLGEQ